MSRIAASPHSSGARRCLVLLLALALAAAPSAAAERLVTAVDSVGFTVADLGRSTAFFTEVLDFRPVAEVEVATEPYARLEGVSGLRMRVARLALGRETIELTQYLAPAGRPIPPGARSDDLSFQHIAIVVADMDRAYARLREQRVRHVSPGPQTLPAWNPAAGGIRAFYFEDPDGHVLELIQFPPGKGEVRWQEDGGRLFLGIDHTAIVVRDTEASLRFYRDTLALRVTGASENWGPEQERLNDVEGARLRITSLRAPAGPGIELLEYLSPAGGRDFPADLGANDLQHWQTRLGTGSAAAAGAALAVRRIAFVSPGTVELPARELGFAAGLTVRDPDGHALQLVSP